MISSSNNVFANIAGNIFGGAIVDNVIAQMEPVLDEAVSAEGLISMAKNDNNSTSENKKEDKKAVFTSKGVNYMNLLKAGKFNKYNEFEFFLKSENEEEENGESEICSFVCKFQDFKWVYTNVKFKDNWEKYVKKQLNLNIPNSNNKEKENGNENKNEDDE